MFDFQQQRCLELKVQALHAEIKRHDIPYLDKWKITSGICYFYAKVVKLEENR